MCKSDLPVNLHLIRSTRFCQIFLKQYALAGNCLKYRGDMCHIRNQKGIIRHEAIPNHTHLEEVGFNLCDIHTAYILRGLHIRLKLIGVKIGNHLLLICTAKQNHLTEIRTVISHFTEKLIQQSLVQVSTRRRNGSSGVGSAKFQHTTGFICDIRRRGNLISATDEGKFHITGNLNQLLLNLPSLFICRVRVLPRRIQPGHSAGIALLCVGQINHFLMNLNNILFLLPCNVACCRGGCGSTFGNLRLCRFREIIKNGGREFKIICLSATRKPANHGKKRGLGGIGCKEFTRIVG